MWLNKAESFQTRNIPVSPITQTILSSGKTDLIFSKTSARNRLTIFQLKHKVKLKNFAAIYKDGEKEQGIVSPFQKNENTFNKKAPIMPLLKVRSFDI